MTHPRTRRSEPNLAELALLVGKDPEIDRLARRMVRLASKRYPKERPTTALRRYLHDAAMDQGLFEPLTPPREERERKAIHHGIKRAVFDRDGWECQICGDHKSLVVDHVIPWSKGGPDEMDNYQTLCAPCNAKKRDN